MAVESRFFDKLLRTSARAGKTSADRRMTSTAGLTQLPAVTSAAIKLRRRGGGLHITFF